MCGIFGIISENKFNSKDLKVLSNHAMQRGKDSSGLVYFDSGHYVVKRADYSIAKLLSGMKTIRSSIVAGHSRLITNGLDDNQPVIRDNIAVIHNGIIINHDNLWSKSSKKRLYKIDTEIINALAAEMLEAGNDVADIPKYILDKCEGVINCVMLIPEKGKLLLFSNNGSLYIGEKNDQVFFSSELFPLNQIGCVEIRKIKSSIIIDIPSSSDPIHVSDIRKRTIDLIPPLILKSNEEKLLQYPKPALKRCTKCVLPETMPFIEFDSQGVCNYCNNYKPRNNPRPKEELFNLIEPYRRPNADDCIVPFSGGRDSCYSLHIIAKELKMKPIAYTYDWGMVTDLGRRNISRMCAQLGVENIIVAADIEKKRENIRKNVLAWLKYPDLGMISIFTAGDKHFFRHVETVKKQTGIDLNIWGVNPLEVTHFKSGFLGVPPDFAEKRVYSHGIWKQLRYHKLRFAAMMKSPGYFNGSLWDTLSGEYYRSFTEKKDYFHLFDYWRFDEKIVDDVLALYDWEKAPDTKTTWRIGDGTAAFYNYIYYTVAGFSEHDTFRSNQIREGDITREEALKLLSEENTPRYPNLKWYLDAIGLDFKTVISKINNIKKLY